jgi:N-acetylmuramic acid 6-phosphate (MurNAc-6-P) etherase
MQTNGKTTALRKPETNKTITIDAANTSEMSATSTRLQCATSQKTVIFTITAVRK